MICGSSPCAWGKSRAHPGLNRFRPVHPHVRGANASMSRVLPSSSGSSPRAWGKCGHLRLKLGAVVRFIPTCVGQMEPAGVSFTPTYGSSPRAWGKSPKTRKAWSICTVHPHVRGANVFRQRAVKGEARFIPTCVGQMNVLKQPFLRKSGSSPRAWGKFVEALGKSQTVRFIPTCVGQIPVKALCGLAVFGSSPRAWGKY